MTYAEAQWTALAQEGYRYCYGAMVREHSSYPVPPRERTIARRASHDAQDAQEARERAQETKA